MIHVFFSILELDELVSEQSKNNEQFFSFFFDCEEHRDVPLGAVRSAFHIWSRLIEDNVDISLAHLSPQLESLRIVISYEDCGIYIC